MIGLSPDVFWSLTPWQFRCCLDAHKTKTENEHDHAAWIMYHGAILQRVKKVPPLKDFLSGAKKVSAKVDEHAIIANLRQYQQEQDSKKVSLDDRC